MWHDFFLGVVGGLGGAVAWGLLFRSRSGGMVLGEAPAGMAITEAEYELVLSYRETRERVALHVMQDGCGSCPSAQK
jgi:hypothetical protein